MKVRFRIFSECFVFVFFLGLVFLVFFGFYDCVYFVSYLFVVVFGWVEVLGVV